LIGYYPNRYVVRAGNPITVGDNEKDRLLDEWVTEISRLKQNNEKLNV